MTLLLVLIKRTKSRVPTDAPEATLPGVLRGRQQKLQGQHSQVRWAAEGGPWPREMLLTADGVSWLHPCCGPPGPSCPEV